MRTETFDIVNDQDAGEATFSELTAYVSMGDMDAKTAKRIWRAKAPHARKREVAALIASGSLEKKSAIKLLRMSGKKEKKLPKWEHLHRC